MSQPFTFPPPPPPPPKPSSSKGPYQQQSTRGSQRGRGNFPPGQHNSRGGGSRGQLSSRGAQRGRGGAFHGNGVNHRPAGQSSYNQNNNIDSYQSPQSIQQDGSFSLAQKRPHATAFNNQRSSNHDLASARPLAPPAVPSFGVNFEALLPKRPQTQPPTASSVPSSAPKRVNLLGLTPAVKSLNNDSESESDAEEESKLAGALSTNTDALKFEYNGQPSSLSTPEEIASWIAERRSKWPTEAKRETARQLAEERRKKYEAEKAARLEASKAAAKARQIEREKQKLDKEKSIVRRKLLQEQISKAATTTKTDGKGDTDDPQSAAQLKAERLRKKAARVAQKLARAELALEKQTQDTPLNVKANATNGGSISNENGDSNETDIDILVAQVDQIAATQQPPNPNLTDVDMASDSENLSDTDNDLNASPADDTSTSGSSSESDSDSDAPPEQLSSKLAPNPLKPPSTRIDNRPPCVNYTKTGRCKFGRRCHYKHEKPAREKKGGPGSGAGPGTEGGKRKGLYQIMVDKEDEEERRKALRVIIGLGERGWLDGDGQGQGEGDTKMSGPVAS